MSASMMRSVGLVGNTLPGARQPHSPAAPCVTCGKPFLSELSSSLGLPNRGRRSRASASLEGVDWADLLDDVPEIADDLMEFQGRVGALFDEGGVAASFGEENDRKASEAWEHGIVIADRSHWGRIRVSGDDRLTFLHAQSTADLAALQPGSGTPTVRPLPHRNGLNELWVFVTATGRTIDTGLILGQKGGAMALVSPGMTDALVARFSKYIFPLDRVVLTDVAPQTRMFTLLGPEAHTLVAEWGGEDRGEELTQMRENSHTVLSFNGTPVLVVRSSGLGSHVAGWTFIVSDTVAADFWRKAALKGALPMGSAVWEHVRILNGVPRPGAELTEAVNPLEAGLYHAVSLAKGCYIGQETLAKVHNNNGVKQQLWGCRLREGQTCSVGSTVIDDGDRKLGSVTSITTVGDHPFALAYLRCRADGAQVDLEGLQVAIDGIPAKVTRIAHASRQFDQASMPVPVTPPTSKEPKNAEKEARVKAMADRLAAWKAQQQS